MKKVWIFFSKNDASSVPGFWIFFPRFTDRGQGIQKKISDISDHIQSIGLANHHNDSFLFQMNHPEYTRNTRTVPAIPGYPELFEIPGIIPGIPGKLPKFFHRLKQNTLILMLSVSIMSS